MTLFLDVQYLNEISFRFDKFAKKGPYLYNLRCPLCGDSSKNKNKARGYFFESKNALFYKCHNCGASKPFSAMLKEVDPVAYKNYALEKFKSATPIDAPKPKKKEPKVVMPAGPSLVDFEFLEPVLGLEKNHEAKAYLFSRKIPLKYWSLFWYVKKTKWLNALSDKYTGHFINDEPRLVIPFFGPKKELLGVHARSFEANPKQRYISLKLCADDVPYVFGQERFDKNQPSYVLEGPIDSLFLPNALALGNASLYQIGDLVNKDTTTLVFDRQPRNKDVVLQINRSINKGYRVTMWPDTIEAKDINDMVKDGIPTDELTEIIDLHSYQGLEAQAHMKLWRKC
jgi:hypothetical protein